MFKKISHIGIAVKDLEKAIERFVKLSGVSEYHIENVEEQKVRVAVFNIGGSRIELTEATDPDSPIAKFISKRGEGIHHIAFEVDDIKGELERLKPAFKLVDEKPRRGSGDSLIAFVHPSSTGGVLIEITQETKK